MQPVHLDEKLFEEDLTSDEQGEARIYYLRERVIFPYSKQNVSLPLSAETRNLEEGIRLIAYPIRCLTDILMYRFRTATLVEVISSEIKDNSCRVTLQGISRVRVTRLHSVTRASYRLLRDQDVEDPGDSVDRLRRKAQELVFLINVEQSDRLIAFLNFLTHPSRLTDFISHYFVNGYRQRYRLLKDNDPRKRNNLLMVLLDRLIRKIKKRKPDR